MTKQRPISTRPVLAFIGLGLLVMLWAATDYFRAKPGLTLVPPSQQDALAAAPTTSSTTSSTTAQNSGMTEGVMRLMQSLQQNPNDIEALKALAQHFMHLEDWSKAETFALRAMVAAPSDASTLHLLGIIQHNQSRHQEAAATLEKSLTLANDPATHYSLGILYGYFLNDTDKSRAHLDRVLQDNTAPEAMKDHARDELKKLSTPKS